MRTQLFFGPPSLTAIMGDCGNFVVMHCVGCRIAIIPVSALLWEDRTR